MGKEEKVEKVEKVEFAVTDLAASAIAVHEVYTEYVKAGFTEDQALEIIIAMIVDSLKE